MKQKSHEERKTTECKKKGTVNLISQDSLLGKEKSVFIFNAKSNCFIRILRPKIATKLKNIR
jgi:hypothetical protein